MLGPRRRAEDCASGGQLQICVCCSLPLCRLPVLGYLLLTLSPDLPAVCRNHGCEIVKIEFLKLRFKKIGCFLTVSKDGLLQFWTETFSLINSFKVSENPVGCSGSRVGTFSGTVG